MLALSKARAALGLALALSLAPEPAAAASPSAAPRRCIAVVGTNDLHGALVPTLRQAPVPLGTAMAGVRSGGVAALSGYLRALRHSYGERLLLLDAGDLFQGTLASNLSEGRAVISAYNLLHYHGAAIGNHEFDFGSGRGAPAGADPVGTLKARIAAADFPFFSLNVVDVRTQARIAWPNTRPSILKRVGDVCVGIMGISTVDTPRVTRPSYVADLRFLPPAPLVEAEALALRQAGAELVVLVGHLGGACSDLRDPNDARSCDQGELLRLLRAMPPGTVDVAIGGHTHQLIAHWIDQTATLESGARGNFFGYVEACVDPKGGIDRAHSSIHGAQALCLDVWADGNCQPRRRALLPTRAARFLAQGVEPEPAMLQTLQPYLDAVQSAGAQRLPIDMRRALPAWELARLLAEAMRASTHSDFALQNVGGVRAAMPAGPVRYGQLFEVVPFDNKVVQLHLRGAQIEALLANVQRQQQRFGAAAIAGLQLQPQAQGPARPTTLKGQALQPQRIYTVAVSDFMAEGGDAGGALRSLDPACKTYTDLDTRQALLDYLARCSPAL